MIRKRIVLSAVFVLAVVTFCYGYSRTNQKYPKAVLETVGIKESIEVEGIQFFVKNVCFYTAEELKQRKNFPKDAFYTDDMCLITLDVTIKNISGDAKNVEAAYRRIETLGWSGGVDMRMYALFNQDNPRSVMELQDNEETSFTLTFPIVPLNFNDKDWAEIEKKEFQYVLSLYPVKKVVDLNFKEN